MFYIQPITLELRRINLPAMQIPSFVVLLSVLAVFAVEVAGLPAPAPEVSIENLSLLGFQSYM